MAYRELDGSLRFYMDKFGPECYFLVFRALQDGCFRFFFKKFQKIQSYFKVPNV